MIRYITELPSSEWENSFPRPVVLLGSTGSIGVNTLRIIEKHPDLFDRLLEWETEDNVFHRRITRRETPSELKARLLRPDQAGLSLSQKEVH